MKRLLHQLPLILGCMFLAWVMILMVQDVTMSYKMYGTVSEKYEYDHEFEDEYKYEFDEEFDYGSEYGYEEQGKKDEPSFLRKSIDGLYCTVNSFIYAYNECGYYDKNLSYIPMGKQGFDYLTAGFILLYVVIVFLLCVPVVAAGYTVQIYVLTGGIFALILLLGEIPQYGNLILLVTGWIYVNLSKQWIRMRGEKTLRIFLKEFPASLFPVYAVIILLIILMPVLMPGDSLPEADKETKDMIFKRLQEIRLVSNQYEEKKKQKENQVAEPSEEFSMDMEDETEDNAEDNTEDDVKDGMDVNGGEVGYPENNLEDYPQDGLPDRENGLQQDGNQMTSEGDGQQSGTDGGMDFLSGIGSGKEFIFTLSSGGGVSGGRTDLTGNLKFDGRSVLRATMDHRPEKNLYIRLFYAEDYENSRWKQMEGPQFDDSSLFYSLKDGDAGGQEDTFLHLEYPGHFSDEIVFGNSRSASLYYPELSEYLTGACMEVPEELENLFAENYPGIFGEERENQEDQKGDSAGRNEAIADEIKKVLEETAYYTLSPGSAPKNEDFIKWFLTENKKGYCMHFASAGVMMLRAAGVSSRYAEGYVVPVSAWEEQEDGSWCAEILDSNAHAWAEIYQENGMGDGVGSSGGYWVPVELTPAYRGELADSFAGEQDAYVGTVVIPGWVIWAARMVFRAIFIVLVTAGGMILVRTFRLRYEYRMIHTGDAGQDILNMMRILLKKPARKNGKIRKVFKKNYLTRQELNEEILCNVPEWNKDQESREWFEEFSTYVYRAAFDGKINEEDRREAGVLYNKLRKKLVKDRRKSG